MTSKKVAKREQLAQARAQKLAAPALSDAVSHVDVGLEVQLQTVTAELMAVRSLLEDERQQSAALSLTLKQSQSYSDEVLKLLEAEKKCSEELAQTLKNSQIHTKHILQMLATSQASYKDLYSDLRVERRAHQRGDKRNADLKKQIVVVKSENMKKDEDFKSLSMNVSNLVNATLSTEREKDSLRKELSYALERHAAEMQEFQQQLKKCTAQLKSSQRLIKRLQNQCRKAKIQQEKAVKQGRDRVLKERSAHRLLNKGVYSEATRNLVRFLVRVGVSREHVNNVIHTVLKIAGVTVHGDVSRRTVSRVIAEGLYMATTQLGHEMEQAQSEF